VTLTFNLLTSNGMGDQDLSCTMHLPSLMMIFPVIFCFRVLTYAPTYTHTYRADKRPAHASTSVCVSNDADSRSISRASDSKCSDYLGGPKYCSVAENCVESTWLICCQSMSQHWVYWSSFSRLSTGPLLSPAHLYDTKRKKLCVWIVPQ